MTPPPTKLDPAPAPPFPDAGPPRVLELVPDFESSTQHEDIAQQGEVHRLPWVGAPDEQLRVEPLPAPATVTLGGVALAVLTEAEASARIVACGQAGAGEWFVTANLDHLRQYAQDGEARRLIDLADIVVADGTPLIWGSRLLREPLPERVAGSNMIFSIAREAAERGASIFFLGGNPGTAEACVGVLEEQYPGLRVAGVLCPEYGFERDAEALSAIEQAVTTAEPDVVLVALGFPKQDQLIERLRAVDARPSYIGVGVSFSFVAGEISRAPEWMHGLGLEWMHRMLQEPGRLVERYLKRDLPFGLRLFARLARRRLQHR